MKQPDITIVIPVYNERESLTELTARIVALAKSVKKVVSVVWVDDGSTDGSFDALVQLKKNSTLPMTIVRFRKNMGKSAALAVGFSHATGEKVVTLDADLQDDPTDIPPMLAKLNEGYDLVVGWRKPRLDPWKKVMLSRIFNGIVSRATGVHLHDMNIGLKAYRHAVVEELHLYGELHRYIPVLAAARGFTVTEIPVHHHPRIHGKSKFGTGRIIHAALDLVATLFLLSFSQQPLQLFGITGGAATLTGVVVLVYLSILHFLGQSIGDRPLLLLGVMLVLFGVQLISTGLLAELLTSQQNSHKQYPVAEIV